MRWVVLALLALVVLAPSVSGARPEPIDVLLVGDSLAYQLGPRLRKAIAPRRLQTVARGGSSARQWLRHRWFQRAAATYPAKVMLVSLGTNCIRSERPELGADMVQLIRQARAPVVWLLPPPLRFSTDYIRRAVEQAEVRSFAPGPLKLEHDGVHPTDSGHQEWARRIEQSGILTVE